MPASPRRRGSGSATAGRAPRSSTTPQRRRPTRISPCSSSGEPMLTVEGVPAAAIERLWPRVLPCIERALAEGLGHLDSTDLRAALERRDMQLWIARREEAVIAALVTEIVVYPRRKVCRFVLMGG